MEKKEKKADLEQLLNNLVSKGWKPRNVISKNTYIYKVKDKINLSYSEFLEDEGEVMHEDEWYSLRDLVSKSSGLWQFVCENEMLDADYDYEGWALVDAEDGCISEHETGCREIQTNTDWGYRLIESSLKDESELEDFLLSNIKVEGLEK